MFLLLDGDRRWQAGRTAPGLAGVVRFPALSDFAGDFPIESPSGQRIGALCVVGCTPRRRADDIDVDFLKQLALLAQRELWEILSVDAA